MRPDRYNANFSTLILKLNPVMHLFSDLFPTVASKIVPPVLVVLGPPWPVTQIVGLLGGVDTTCLQMDVYQADRLREKLAAEGHAAKVVVAADVWDLPANVTNAEASELPTRFRTVLFPAVAQSDRELKLDMIEQAYHVLEAGGRFITLSEYERDTLFAKAQKRVFGKCGESPRSKDGMAFWSTREDGDHPRRRHEITFHAKIGDRPSMHFTTWPGTFSYGRMDDGSRAMLEVADVRPGDKILDLGCGNGSVGCLASQECGPLGVVTFLDSHARAIELSKINAQRNGVANAKFVLSASSSSVGAGEFDVVLANPPYYANSEVARAFIFGAREVLRPGGRFYFVTRMPVRTIPDVVDIFGEVESVENRGFTVVIARA